MTIWESHEYCCAVLGKLDEVFEKIAGVGDYFWDTVGNNAMPQTLNIATFSGSRKNQMTT